MMETYWLGIDRDLDEILRTLNLWENSPPQQPVAGSEPEGLLGLESFVKRATRSDSSDVILGLWLNPCAPQLTVDAAKTEDQKTDIKFVPLECSQCRQAIQGSHFQCISWCTLNNNAPNQDRPPVFCETCAREPGRSAHPPDHLRKIHKSCVLSTCIPEQQAGLKCSCPDVVGAEEAAQYPFSGIQDRARHDPRCPLRVLKSAHCSAKTREMPRLNALQVAGDGGLQEEASPVFLSGQRLAARVLKVGDDIPYGNVHMSLMVGPLIIENGVPDSKRGVLISVRDRLQLHSVANTTSSVTRCLALCTAKDKMERKMYCASKHLPRNRRIKAFMKQVVGSPFWGLVSRDECAAELDIVKEVARAGLAYSDLPMKTPKFNADRKRAARVKITEKLHKLLFWRVNSYLHAIVNRLFDTSLELEWNIISNNCQRFCDAIIDRRVFGSFMVYGQKCTYHGPPQALYLLSFVSRVGCHDGFPRKVIPRKRADAANGHTEEFLLRYRRFGQHSDTDIIDSLTQYWSDWGGFGEPLFRHQDLFPWDCTEARTQEEEDVRLQEKCGECKLAKHLWAFPFDSWSLAQLHLFRERRFYAPRSATAAQLSHKEWMDNRFGVLEALQALGSVAVAMRRSRTFRDSCMWNFVPRGLLFPNTCPVRDQAFLSRKSRTKQLARERGPGNLVSRPGSALVVHDRVKLAGIHRAQPQSHLYDHDRLYDCTLADWADLARDAQVAEYVALRDLRARLVDEVIEDARGRHQSGLTRSAGNPTGNPSDGTGVGVAVGLEGHGVAPDCDGSGAVVDCTATSDCSCVCDPSAMESFSSFDAGACTADGSASAADGSGSAGDGGAAAAAACDGGGGGGGGGGGDGGGGGCGGGGGGGGGG
ncbi:hypothetical protein PspLS_03927 [Pyricularia sp. CBS 133598]|nr:hypothetical protein PspLS_03927 [Pyricularia sp. CBS 133598]